jgi:hypothetical protein
VATKITKGPVEVDPETSAIGVPVTIWLTKEVVEDLRGRCPLDLREEMAKIIGQEIVEFPEKN